MNFLHKQVEAKISNLSYSECINEQKLRNLLPNVSNEKKLWIEVASKNFLGDLKIAQKRGFLNKNNGTKDINLSTLKKTISDTESSFKNSKSVSPKSLLIGVIGTAISGGTLYGGYAAWTYLNSKSQIGAYFIGQIFGPIAAKIIIFTGLGGLVFTATSVVEGKDAVTAYRNLNALKRVYKNAAIIEFLQKKPEISDKFLLFNNYYDFKLNYLKY